MFLPVLIDISIFASDSAQQYCADLYNDGDTWAVTSETLTIGFLAEIA
jgi:hypothetical protein